MKMFYIIDLGTALFADYIKNPPAFAERALKLHELLLNLLHLFRYLFFDDLSIVLSSLNILMS
jgi:hypothetical protein